MTTVTTDRATDRVRARDRADLRRPIGYVLAPLLLGAAAAVQALVPVVTR